MRVLNFTVNGTPRTVHLEEGRIMLASVLRDSLGLTGTKVGCGTGHSTRISRTMSPWVSRPFTQASPW